MFWRAFAEVSNQMPGGEFVNVLFNVLVQDKSNGRVHRLISDPSPLTDHPTYCFRCKSKRPWRR
jgi:hypothetical protein